MLSPGSLLSQEWYSSTTGKAVLSSLMTRNLLKRKPFGILDKPVLPLNITADEVKYKILLVGKSGIGKTSTIAKLSGNEIPATHSETPGIHITTTQWPGMVKQMNKIVMFHLQFWDVGDGAMKKYEHIKTTWENQADCVIFLFSFVDRGSFEEISQHITRMTKPKNNFTKLVIGTKFDQHAYSEITQRDIRDFEHTWKVPILKIRNVPDTETKNDINEISQILTTICEHLWHRDIVLAGRSVPTSDGKISAC
ncbi:ciliogenesis and planar polarity effector 2-like [Crassostrea angulata]|uniref:ciliogenesis and planar polarity effector 2-like n=1 Tax=Magallana angulata TaxID=2784310 RepID=UPI0009751DB5|nr:ciliogenesis and planar polarity effector 2-like [Crassostrea angulata]|eukprot:XP_019921297.1 PREDICTED: REM2- and Rab-like small GTPase 1 [Crassostrea gigas]